ncbi:MAG: type II toxin-antitoxin system RelE/ParE family toxin [Candidatus Methylomirabilales bacterium]
MAEYRIVLARSTERDLRNLQRVLQLRLIKVIDTLATHPRPVGVKKLRGTRDLWRIRVGDYRVIYRIDDREQLIDVTHVRHRKEAYE